MLPTDSMNWRMIYLTHRRISNRCGTAGYPHYPCDDIRPARREMEIAQIRFKKNNPNAKIGCTEVYDSLVHHADSIKWYSGILMMSIPNPRMVILVLAQGINQLTKHSVWYSHWIKMARSALYWKPDRLAHHKTNQQKEKNCRSPRQKKNQSFDGSGQQVISWQKQGNRTIKSTNGFAVDTASLAWYMQCFAKRFLHPLAGKDLLSCLNLELFDWEINPTDQKILPLPQD